MTDKDRLIKKLWLLSYIIINLGYFIYMYSQQMIPKLNNSITFTLFFNAVPTLLVIYLYYHCAYKKIGTKLLTLLLIVMPIVFAINFVLLTTGMITFAQSGLYPLQLIPSIWLYVLTWKVRKINKKLQAA